MSYETLKLHRISPHVGAEVQDIDITRPLTNRQVEELHRALGEFGVLFFREQRFDHDSQKRFGRYFGELDIHPNTPGPEGHPEILPIHADANSKVIAGEKWHSDVSCFQEPPLGSILHIHTTPPAGGDTLFASLAAAYEALSPRLKTYLEGLTAFHSGERNYRRRNALHGIDDRGRVFPSAVHPVVIRHPISGRKGLYVNRLFTYRINEVSEEESEAILNHLLQHAEKPDFQIRFQWQPHSVAFWDNRAVQHLAIWDYFPHVRTGSRVTVKGGALAA
ncbi:TauD/TfdA dioxygenase family protein [Roseococcus pinisoli]|uniref:TauD/TfdA family dioxygenase n=1 Tax=Roseococcus pinisoli TaxID=2835040 RepID=A0ABS5QK52_9PROT|nr:TauD/TfdA family dioxygenase [Roseococcus pinisoli]MBS7813397.1 TauD/TfdA family dioxygenase [Roseococcus pinisoli]